MTTAFRLCFAALSCLLVACGGALPNEAPKRSPHFDEVSSHLHLGGEVYFYADIDGDLAHLAGVLTDLITQIEPGEKVEREQILRVLRATGVYNMQALGLSSYQDGSLFRNRAYLAFDQQREGLMKVTGGAPHPFEALALAPSGSDLVLEQDMHLKQAFDVVLSTLAAFEPQMAKEIEQELANPLPGLSVTGTQLVAAADTKLLVVAKLDSERSIDLTDFDSPVSLPHVDFAVALDGYGFLVEQAADQYGQSGLFDVSRDEDLLVLQLTVPAPPAFQGYKPVLARQGERLWLSSTRAFLDATLRNKGKKLASDAAWEEASVGLPHAGNGLSYLSPEFFGLLRKLATQLPQGDEERAFSEAFVKYFLPDGEDGIAGVQVNDTDSLYYASNSTFSHKSTLGVLLYANPITLGVIAAVAIPSFMRDVEALSVPIAEIPPPVPPIPTPAPLPVPAKVKP